MIVRQISLYVSLYNIFVSLLSILGFASATNHDIPLFQPAYAGALFYYTAVRVDYAVKRYVGL